MSRGLKRAFDVVVSAAALVVLSPILAAAAVAVLISAGRPILFRQQRPGRHGEPFEMVKFRTMRDDVFDEDGQLASSDRRVTRVGYLLRKTSVDELPELYNVLRGDMSLVGPRPLLMQYLELYTPEQARRHAMRPGITGWAQVHGREYLDFEQRFELDVWYVDHWSFALDMLILRETVRQAARGTGVAPPDTPDVYFTGPASAGGTSPAVDGDRSDRDVGAI